MGQRDFPARTVGYEEALVADWIQKSSLRDASTTGLALKAHIDPIIRAVRRDVCHGKAERFVAKIDAAHLTKSVPRTGLVPEDGDAEWLRENIDLGTPLATLQYLEQLAVRVRGRGAVSTADLGAALDEFLAHAAVFRDVMDRFQQPGFMYPGFRGAVSDFMRRLLASSDRVTRDRALECFNPPVEMRPQDAFRWVVENLPVRIERTTRWCSDSERRRTPTCES